MSDLRIRPAKLGDLARLTEIYNYYVRTSPITFDIDEVQTQNRTEWFENHSDRARHQLLVADDGTQVVGYAGTGSYRSKAAYDTTVETTIYVAPDKIGERIGTRLYAVLFETIAHEDIHRVVAGITLPNDASLKLHERFGFTRVGVFTQCGRKFGRYWDVVWMERGRNKPIP